METIKQKTDYRIIQDKKTIDWLINNSEVFVFDPLTFKGYQRELEEAHWKKIINYIIDNDDFFFPTSIICACDEVYTDNSRLRIVDGQHRIQAFRELEKIHKDKYDKILDKELPIIVLEKIPLTKEIETFININKKGKKVDTSLATVLNHTISDKDDLEKRKAKIEYIAVEVARELSLKEGNIWENQICFEGNAKKHNQLISINAFVRSTQFLLSNLDNSGIQIINWDSKIELEQCKIECINLIMYIWELIIKKWPELFSKTVGSNSIIQGPIGYSSINKFIVFLLKKNTINNKNDFKKILEEWINKISVQYTKWIPGESGISYSNYSSEAGYTFVANALIDSMNI